MRNVAARLIVDVDAPDARSTLAAGLIEGTLGPEKVGFGEGKEDLFDLFDRMAGGERLVRGE